MIECVREIALPVHRDARGVLVPIEFSAIPFPVRRIFFASEVPPGCTRGGHAHRRTEQVVVAASGRFTIDLFDGSATRTFQLDDPGRGIYIPPYTWDCLYGFSPEAVALVIASQPYDESDYIKDQSELRATFKS